MKNFLEIWLIIWPYQDCMENAYDNHDDITKTMKPLSWDDGD